MDELRMPTNESRVDKGGAFCASLLFHVLLLLVLASNSSFDIRLAEKSRFDVIFWLSPSSAAPQGEPVLPPDAKGPGLAGKSAGGVKGAAAAVAPAERHAPAAAPAASAAAPPRAPSKVRVETPASPPPEPARTEAPADATLLLSSSGKATPAPAAVKEERVVSSIREQRAEPAAKVTAPAAEPERNQPSALTMPVRLGSFFEEKLSGGNQGAVSTRTAATVATSKARSEGVPAAASGPSAAAEESAGPRGAARVVAAFAVTQRDQPAPVRNERPAAEKHAEPRGIMTSSLQGDLKMIISGDSGIRLLVTFRDYPKSRRNRPLSRMEARREQQIQPLVAKTDEDTREAVVETARDGIYIFTAEPEHGERREAKFTLKLFERGGKERTAQIGVKSISQKAVLTRVLMRDGILWDDDSAFTGSMEDSESTTKFNANTGLYWKEYHH